MKNLKSPQAGWAKVALIVAVIALCLSVVSLIKVTGLAGPQDESPTVASQSNKTEDASTETASANMSAQQPVRLDFRLAQRQESTGLRELELLDGSVWYQPQSVLTRENLATVTPKSNDQGQAYVQFVFSEEGARKLTQLSQQYAGKMLVITLGNSLKGIIELSQPVTDGVLNLPLGSEQEAIDMVQRIADNR